MLIVDKNIKQNVMNLIIKSINEMKNIILTQSSNIKEKLFYDFDINYKDISRETKRLEEDMYI